MSYEDAARVAALAPREHVVALVERFQVLTLHAIDAVEREDYDGLRALLRARSMILDEIERLPLGDDALGALASVERTEKRLMVRISVARRTALEQLVQLFRQGQHTRTYLSQAG